MNETNQQLVDMMENVWRSIGELCDGLTEAQWKTPTDCPGWSVQDQVSHLAGSETGILGDPDPDHTPGEEALAHTRSEQGRHNEIVVDWRRPWAGAQVLSDFRAKTARRVEFLRSRSDEDFAAEMQTPVGPAPMSEFISIRIMDAWVHEQDIRRAVNRPGHYNSPAAAHALNRIIRTMPFVAARRAQAPDGATVVMDISDVPSPSGGGLGWGRASMPIGVEGGRGRELDQTPDSPTVRISLDAETFGCLGCGRWNPDEVLQSGKVSIEGDTALGESIVRQMNIMP